MKRYFWSGNTNMVNGYNSQMWGVATVEDDVDPTELANQIAKDKKEQLEADSFCLVAFNELP